MDYFLELHWEHKGVFVMLNDLNFTEFKQFAKNLVRSLRDFVVSEKCPKSLLSFVVLTPFYLVVR